MNTVTAQLRAIWEDFQPVVTNQPTDVEIPTYFIGGSYDMARGVAKRRRLHHSMWDYIRAWQELRGKHYYKLVVLPELSNPPPRDVATQYAIKLIVQYAPTDCIVEFYSHEYNSCGRLR
jgi:hypothetical protein